MTIKLNPLYAQGSGPSDDGSSRRTIIDQTSQSISGTYTLLDLLSLHSQSGSINVSVQPGPASNSLPLPAVLKASNMSGTIDVAYPYRTFDYTNRNYETEASSASGSITGVYPLGRLTSFNTMSGSIQASFIALPFQLSPSLNAKTMSGRIDVAIVDDSDMPLLNLRANYKTTSGHVRLVYPTTWEGTIQVQTMSGSVDVEGEGIKIIKDVRGIDGSRTVEATKGDLNAVSRGSYISTMSGSVAVRVGG